METYKTGIGNINDCTIEELVEEVGKNRRIGCVYPNNIDLDGGGSYYICSNLVSCVVIEAKRGYLYAEEA